MRTLRLSLRFATTTLLAVLGCVISAAAAQYTQSITLDNGWNAIWLEVEPVYTSGTNVDQPMLVTDVFTDTGITIVATPENPVGSAEFLTDAETLRFNQATWRVWRRVSELQNDTLATINGNQAYLIYFTGGNGMTVNVTGNARFHLPQWQADSYNLKGFGLTTSVTFNNFFAASGGRHPVNKIFRLQSDGAWVGVRSTDYMQSGKAYWIYSDGPSSFCGPVKVSFDGIADGLDFGDGPGDVSVPDPQGNPGDKILINKQEITFSDVSGTGQTVTVQKVSPSTTGGAALTDDLRIYEVSPNATNLSYGLGQNGQIVTAPFSVPANSSKTVTLGAFRAWTSGATERENLFQIQFAYNYLWLPIKAATADWSDAVSNASSPSYAGLWVGEVVLDKVTSITESGRPLQSTSSKAPMRVIVHVGTNGTASLLSSVMFMQTKTATNTVKPDEVLVVDESKIPYFEGIQTRGDKKVGKRIETIGYDMPRKMDPTNQAALVSAAATALGITNTANVTEANILTYINGQATRPVALVDKYYTSWPLTGSLNTNALVTTTLTMDPFHRSNPFRHAYHPKHPTGYALTRAITMRFGSKYQAGILTGTYEESISGLASFPLTTTGSITLRRLSTVGTLQ